MSEKLVYHGSGEKFSEFDYAKIGRNGTSEGIGFYFTDNVQIARGYATKNSPHGYLYKVDFKGHKSLASDKKSIKKSDFIRFAKILQQESLKIDLDFIANYGDMETLIQCEYDSSDSDVDIICGIIHGFGNKSIVLRLLHEILGYDCIILKSEWGNQTLFIALVHSAYEIIEIENCN